MNRFFFDAESMQDNLITFSGQNARHIINVLRLRRGDNIIACDGKGIDYKCVLTDFNRDNAIAQVLEVYKNTSERLNPITLFQCIPKGDKMDFIVEKSVELGVYSVVPVLSQRCISRPDSKTAPKKVDRWNSISESAAKQSGRGIIPRVADIISFNDAICQMVENYDRAILFYENERENMIDNNLKSSKSIAFMIGPEGGFSDEEIPFAREKGILIMSLGKRILRCETAPICALSILNHITENT